MMMNRHRRSLHCPLCESERCQHLLTDDTRHVSVRDYFECQDCGLIFVPRDQHLSPEEELARYDRHENSPEDPNYRAFLSRLFEPMNEKLTPGSSGLDFGSGPGPTLHLMFEEAGHRMWIYDPFFANNKQVFDSQYDFISCSETAEHLSAPGMELDQLWRCLRPGGWLGIMTRLVPVVEPFESWHYKNDDTHVSFYARRTFFWLKERWEAHLEWKANDVMLFQKPET
jgi:SAM-dependent methyltransferase